ncbi:hypothetical protein [Streptomyces sp. NPDC050504]|uniref:hypothetical protein n=1 Tax=Streptomyces sp. NPDC050504 TaxID=3365618 RepID=UPI0037BDE7B8
MRVAFFAKAAATAAVAAATLTIGAPAHAAQQAALTEVACSTDANQMQFTKFMGFSRCFLGTGDLDVQPTFNTEATWFDSGNHSGWFKYGNKVQNFSKFQHLEGKFYPLSHIHVDN